MARSSRLNKLQARLVTPEVMDPTKQIEQAFIASPTSMTAFIAYLGLVLRDQTAGDRQKLDRINGMYRVVFNKLEDQKINATLRLPKGRRK